MFSVWSWRAIAQNSNHRNNANVPSSEKGQTIPPYARRQRKRQNRSHDVGWIEPDDQNPTILQTPSSPETLLTIKAANHLDELSLKESWFKLIPSRLGRTKTLDLAAEAFIQANDLAIQRTGSSPQNCLQSYAKAIFSLQDFMSKPENRLSDDSLLTCAILAHCERSMGFRVQSKDSPMKLALTHLYGSQAILVSRSATREPSELSLAVLSWQCTILFDVPIAFGVPSPFEKFHWFEPLPAIPRFSSTQVARLAAIGRKLLIHVPRLVMYMRTWQRLLKEGSVGEPISKVFEIAANFAAKLISLKDEDAESALLHSVRVTKTTDASIDTVVPYSFGFPSLDSYEAATYYWQARILVLRLYWRILANLDNTSEQTAQLAGECSRMAHNLLMSWQSGFDQGIFGRIRLLYAVPAIWGAVQDFGHLFKVGSDELRPWLHGRANGLFRPIFGEVEEHDLDEIAEVLAGGELKGTFVKMYQQAWPQKSNTVI